MSTLPGKVRHCLEIGLSFSEMEYLVSRSDFTYTAQLKGLWVWADRDLHVLLRHPKFNRFL